MYRNDIEGLRALSVLLVILFHSKTGGVQAGFLGVDIFFVISGYLITYGIKEKLANNSFSVTDFWNKRLWRLQPVLLAMLIVVSLAVIIAYFPDDFRKYFKSLKFLTFFSSNVYFGEHSAGYFSENVSIMPLLHTWSLSVEWQWYLVLPFMLIGLHKTGAKRAPLILLIITIASGLCHTGRNMVTFCETFKR